MSTFGPLRIQSKSLDGCSSTAVKQFECDGVCVSLGSYSTNGTTLGQFVCVSDAQLDMSIEETEGTHLYARITDILNGKLSNARRAAKIKRIALWQLANHPEHLGMLLQHAYERGEEHGEKKVRADFRKLIGIEEW